MPTNERAFLQKVSASTPEELIEAISQADTKEERLLRIYLGSEQYDAIRRAGEDVADDLLPLQSHGGGILRGEMGARFYLPNPRALIGILVILWSVSSGAEPAPSLFSLVPPGVGLVAGIKANTRDLDRPYLFVPLPPEAMRDWDYFRSLCGADPGKSVDEVIFVADHIDRNEYEHTLLARGHFNSQILYPSALSRGAVQEQYHGLTVLRVPPLAREKTAFDELRWLAIVDSRILLLGTPEYVRQEIDRLLTRHATDPWLAERL